MASLSKFLLVLVAPFLVCALDIDPADSVISKFLEGQSQQEAQLTSYRSVRKYILRAPEKKETSTAEVEMTYEKTRGESFRVLRWTGSAGIYRFALQKFLDGESSLTRPQNRPSSSLSAENYNFTVLGMNRFADRSCYVLRIEPRRKLNSLIEGRIWIDAQDYGVVRLEGNVVANSFWAGQPHITQDFRLINGFWILERSDSVTRARGFGETVLDIEASSQEVPFRRAGLTSAIR